LHDYDAHLTHIFVGCSVPLDKSYNTTDTTKDIYNNNINNSPVAIVIALQNNQIRVTKTAIG